MKVLTATLIGAVLFTTGVHAEDGPGTWNPEVDLRYRLEQVGDDRFERDATASTLRLRLGLTSPERAGFSVGAMVHGNRAVGRSRFNSTANGRTQYPVVADPDDEGVSQAWIRYRAGDGFNTTVGRQRITEDNHRFIGNVGFRQLEQTFDAVSLGWQPDDRWQIDLRYLDTAHRVFGRSHPNPLLAEADLDAWMGTLAHEVGSSRIALYYHRLAFDDRPASHRNTGARMTGPVPAGQGLDYRIEYARQEGVRELAGVSGQNYIHLRLSQRLQTWHWFAGHERLEGDGQYAVQTPLATLHAHNGWTDQLLSTPADGLLDTHVAAGRRFGDWTALIKVHDFRRDSGSGRYGNEYGMMVGHPLPAGLAFEAKAAWFDGSGQWPDVGKLWLTLAGNW